MRKLFSLIAAVLFAGSMMAESISITPDLLKSSYQESTITVGEVSFAYAGAMYNGKNSPTGFASKQLIQLRKSSSGAGEIKNSTELNLKSITIATQNDKDFTLSAGAAADALSAVTKPAGVAAKYACKDNNDADKEADVTLYTFNVEGKKYFDLLNGANAQYIAYITIELAEGGETPVVDEWDEIKFTEAVAAADLAADASFSAGNFSIQVTDPDDKMSIDANPARFGTAEAFADYTHRLKTGGKSTSTKNFITATIPAAGQLRIAVRTGKNADTDRNLVIKQGENELYNRAVVEADTIEGVTEPKIYKYITVDVAAGSVVLSYPTNGINFYAFAFKASGEVPPTPAGCDWDNIAYAGNGSGNADYTDRFKVCLGDPAPNFVNLQAPGWATEAGFYFEFPSAAWGAISLEEGEYQIQGAGILLFASAFLYDAEKEVTVVCQDVTYTLTVKNANPEVAPVEAITCADVYQMEKNDVVDLLNDVVVTFANGKNVWVRDESASMLIFLPAASTDFSAGDVLSGIAGVVDIYNGVTEIKPTAEQVAAITSTPGEAPAAIQVAAVEVADVNKYIVMSDVEAEGSFTEGSQSNLTINGVAVRNQFKNGYTFETGKTYDIYGVVTIYQNNPQVYFISAEEHTTTAIDNTVVSEKAVKMFENGQLIIIKNGVRYNAQGAVVR